MPSPGRREEIVEATLDLLAEVPVADLTTRGIAKRVGVSQPALFRHFRSREQILLAVVELVRGRLGAVAAGVLEADLPADAKLERLAAALLAHVESNPGLPRLLFSDLADDDAVGRALRQLVASQAALVAELVQQGREAELFATHVEPRDAATLFVGMVQGLVLQWELGGRAGTLAGRAHDLFVLLRDGLRGGETPVDARRRAAPQQPARPDGLRALDVRPILAGGDDPLDAILAEVDAAGPGGLVALVAPFEPRPLIALLRGRDHLVRCERIADELWALEVVVGGAPEILALDDLEPPEPLERVLTESEGLGPGEVLLAHVPRHPRLLLPRLAERGLTVETHERPDGTALVRVRRPA